MKPIIRKGCRECVHFLRVRESYNNDFRLRGFCNLGELNGDYGLYVSSSVAQDCPSLSVTLRPVCELEESLTREWDEITTDGDFELFKKRRRADFVELLRKGRHERWVSFKQEHAKTIRKINASADLMEEQYRSLMVYLQVSLENKLHEPAVAKLQV
jgi:myo-inositol-1-phosphate synthase